MACILCGARGILCTGAQSNVITVDGEQATEGVNMAFVSVPASEVRGAACLDHPHETQPIEDFMYAIACQLGLSGIDVVDGTVEDVGEW